VRSNGFCVEWNTYVQEQWLADIGTRLQAYPLPSAGIASRLTYGSDEVFAISFMPQGSLGAIMAKVKVADVINGLNQQAEVSLTTDYASVDQFGQSLMAVARAGAGKAEITNPA
jgi:hypothetical protein